MSHWQDTQNHMVEVDDESIPTPPEDDGEKQRQADLDAQPKSKAPNYMRGWNSVGERYATS